MSLDKKKLKSMAHDALSHPLDPIRGMAFQSTVRPHVMLALLEEIESDAMHMRAFGEVIRSQGEQIDQLKAENEALRKSIAGKVVCDLELFEDLRDSAAAEADQHRQSMGSYRPQRQEVLDHTVNRCDLLIAAAKEASNG